MGDCQDPSNPTASTPQISGGGTSLPTQDGGGASFLLLGSSGPDHPSGMATTSPVGLDKGALRTSMNPQTRSLFEDIDATLKTIKTSVDAITAAVAAIPAVIGQGDGVSITADAPYATIGASGSVSLAQGGGGTVTLTITNGLITSISAGT